MKYNTGGHSVALERTVASAPPPAVITVVSSLTNDADALTVALEKLGEKGYSTVLVGVELKKTVT